jgi:hypothetical protein
MPDDIQRQVLPIPDRAYTGLSTYDAKDPERFKIAMARQ